MGGGVGDGAAAQGGEGGAAGGEEEDVGEAVGDLQGGGVGAGLLGGGELEQEHARGGDDEPHAEAAEAQATARVQTGTESTSTLGAVATAAATSSIPTVVSRSRYGSSRDRDCTHEPSAHVPPPAAREKPASVGLSPRWVTSISGTNDSAAMNDPAATPRSSTTDGSPRAAR